MQKPTRPHGLHSHISSAEAMRTILHAQWCLKVLRLSHYDAVLGDEPASNDAHAENSTTQGRYIITIHVPRDWEDKPIPLKRRVIMHECIHALHAETAWFIDQWMRDDSISDAYAREFDRQFHLNIEYMVDRIQRVIEELDGIPRWPTAKDIAKFNDAPSNR